MFLALKELKHAKLKFILIIFIMVLIAWLVLFVTGLANGLASDNGSAIETSKATSYLLQKDSDQRFTRSHLTQNDFQRAKNFYGTKVTQLSIQTSTITKKNESQKTDVTFFAIDPASFMKPQIIEGKKLTKTSGNTVIADQKIKENGYKLGDTLQDTASGKTFTISGFTAKKTYSHTPVIYINLDQYQAIQLKGSSEKWKYNALALLSDENLVNQSDKLEYATRQDVLQNIPGYSEEQGSLLMMVAFLFIIAAFVLAAFFYVITIQKINQLGILKAIGGKTSYLAANIIWQVIILAMISLIIGNGLTFGVSLLLPDSMPFELSLTTVFLCSGLFLIMAILGSILSLVRVARIDVLDAIGRAN